MFVVRDKKTGLYLKRKNRSWHGEWHHKKFEGETDWFRALFCAKTIDKAKMYAIKSAAVSFVNCVYSRPKDIIPKLKERLEVVPIALCPTGEVCDEEKADVAST